MSGSSPEAELLAAGLRQAEHVATRLERSVSRLAALFPISAQRLPQLAEEEEDGLDAFLKRFEQLTDLLQTRLFRTVLALEGEEVAVLSRRDAAFLLERLGALASADEWAKLVLLRNVLSHEYPEEEERQVDRLNLAFALSTRLLATLAALKDHVRRKHLLKGLPGGEVQDS